MNKWVKATAEAVAFSYALRPPNGYVSTWLSLVGGVGVHHDGGDGSADHPLGQDADM